MPARIAPDGASPGPIVELRASCGRLKSPDGRKVAAWGAGSAPERSACCELGEPMAKCIFPVDLPELEWVEFEAEGYDRPVPGVIYRCGQPPCCGVPLGGISTGCIDIDARGVYGFSTLFNPSAPHPVRENWRVTRKVPALQPMLGLAVGDDVWVLADEGLISGGEIAWCTEPQMLAIHGEKVPTLTAPCVKIGGVRACSEIHYWGH